MSTTAFDQELDASGLNCPMPVVKARKALGDLQAGQTLKVISTDRGSVKDFQGWASIDKRIDLVAQETESAGEAESFIHYLKLTG